MVASNFLRSWQSNELGNNDSAKSLLSISVFLALYFNEESFAM